MSRWIGILLTFLAMPLLEGQPSERRTVFHVRYLTQGMVYLDAGSADGLAEGMAVDLTRREPGDAAMASLSVGRAVIVAVATQSAVCELQSQTLDPLQGDEARLSNEDEVARVRAAVAKARRPFLQVLEFTSGDPLEEEVREYIPRPPLDEVNRFRGRIAFERIQFIDHAAGAASASQNGAAVRVDYSRIGGTYWTLTGYWRGLMTARAAGQPTTMLDLVSRTYQMGLFYSNPKSRYQMGFGRLFLPWASSLGTLDGGYIARRMSPSVTAGFFAGSNPDPTQWNYAPNRQTTGAFVNIEKGNYDAAHWSGTFGVALSRVNWRPERQYLFMENNYSLGQMFSIFQNLEADYLNPKLMNGATGAQLSRSFLTLRIQPKRRISFDLNHNYFRGLPSFDQRLIGTGLVDKYLFTGFSGGVRVEPIGNLLVTATWGASNRSGDAKQSLNQFYGVTWKRLPWAGLKFDARYTRFNSSFGSGSYESAGVSRPFFEGLRLEFQAGLQNTQSQFTSQSRTRFLNSTLEWQFKKHYFLNSGWANYRGQSQNYDQIYFSIGYRFK